jgi:hypothetical protein
LGGAVITETIFAWPGVGRLAVQAIANRDYPVVQAAVFTLASIFVIINFLVDVLYTYVDPRVAYKWKPLPFDCCSSPFVNLAFAPEPGTSLEWAPLLGSPGA